MSQYSLLRRRDKVTTSSEHRKNIGVDAETSEGISLPFSSTLKKPTSITKDYLSTSPRKYKLSNSVLESMSSDTGSDIEVLLNNNMVSRKDASISRQKPKQLTKSFLEIPSYKPIVYIDNNKNNKNFRLPSPESLERKAEKTDKFRVPSPKPEYLRKRNDSDQKSSTNNGFKRPSPKRTLFENDLNNKAADRIVTSFSNTNTKRRTKMTLKSAYVNDNDADSEIETNSTNFNQRVTLKKKESLLNSNPLRKFNKEPLSDSNNNYQSIHDVRKLRRQMRSVSPTEATCSSLVSLTRSTRSTRSKKPNKSKKSTDIIDLTNSDVDSDKYDNNNVFRVPSPMIRKYDNLPKVDFSSDEDTPEPDGKRGDSTDGKKYCPYCNVVLPEPLPQRIRAYLTSIDSASSQPPSPSILLNHPTNVVDQFEFCRIHDAESNIVPVGLQKNYPLKIDFDNLPIRVESMFTELMKVVTGERKSMFREMAMETYKELGRARARRPIALMGRFQKFQ
ncbi:10552_t:CDS:2, partial [Diversispora eburnea]